MEKIGVAVIGVGRWGRNHAHSLSKIEDANLVAVCDTNAKKAELVAQEFHTEHYDNVDSMLQREDIKAVTVCTSWSQLGIQALKALEAGKHVLVEKPMARTIEEAQRMIETANQKNLILTVGFLTRFDPLIQDIKRKVEDGFFGKLQCVVSRRYSDGPSGIDDAEMGIVRDLAIHDIDLARSLFNEDPVEVFARIDKMNGELDSQSHMKLTFGQGKTAFFESVWKLGCKKLGLRVRTLTFVGTDSAAEVDCDKLKMALICPGRAPQSDCGSELPLKLELQHFVSCVIRNERPLVKGIDGLKALQISLAALKSSEKKEPITLLNSQISSA